MARHWILIGVVFIWLSTGLAGAAEMELFKAERFQGGAPGPTRTGDTWIRNPLLYP